MLKRLAGIVLGITMLVEGLEGCKFNSPSELESNFSIRNASKSAFPETSNSFSLTALEESIYQQVNQYRLSRNLPPLRLDTRISQQARRHSQRMAQGNVRFGHDGFQQRVQIIGRSLPYQKAAENVAFNQGHADRATQAVRSWINSRGHRQNMEGQFDLTGIGVAKNAAGDYYFTQIFILKK